MSKKRGTGKVEAGAATPALEALDKAGVSDEVLEHPHDPRTKQGFALEGAELMGLDPDTVYKTLMARVDDSEDVVGIVPATATLNLKQLAKAAGGKRAEMLPVARAQVVTGYIAGGISPLGQKQPHRIFLDESAILQEAIHVSAGKRGWSVKLEPDTLLAVCKGTYAAIADFKHHF